MPCHRTSPICCGPLRRSTFPPHWAKDVSMKLHWSVCMVRCGPVPLWIYRINLPDVKNANIEQTPSYNWPSELPNWRTEDHEKEAAINPGSSQCHLGISAASTSTSSRAHDERDGPTAIAGVGKLFLNLQKDVEGGHRRCLTKMYWEPFILDPEIQDLWPFRVFDEASWGVWALATAGIHDENFFKKAKARRESGGANFSVLFS